VPEGSLEKGREIAMQGTEDVAPCISCHGTDLKGTALAPALAGAFPTYVVRQIYDFRSGKRTGLADRTSFMSTTSRLMSADDIVNVAAYIGSVDP
jgi:cytochrome c553